MEKGIITKSLAGQYTVKTKDDIFVCKARGLFRKDKFKPLCGDIAFFDITDVSDKEGYILKIADRKNSMVRPPVANVDTMVITLSPINPEWDSLLTDMLIIYSMQNDITPIMCINKIDLVKSDHVSAISCQFKKSQVAVCEIDALHRVGMHNLEKLITDGITVFAGQSGAGKSTIINALTGSKKMKTGLLSEKIQRGKNTTRHCELIDYQNGYIVDTPGFSKFDPVLLDPEKIAYSYLEFSQYVNECKFNDCRHINETDCAVLRAVENKDISHERYNRYEMIYNMAKDALKAWRGY